MLSGHDQFLTTTVVLLPQVVPISKPVFVFFFKHLCVFRTTSLHCYSFAFVNFALRSDEATGSKQIELKVNETDCKLVRSFSLILTIRCHLLSWVIVRRGLIHLRWKRPLSSIIVNLLWCIKLLRSCGRWLLRRECGSLVIRQRGWRLK